MHCCHDSSVVAIQVSAMMAGRRLCDCLSTDFTGGVFTCRQCGGFRDLRSMGGVVIHVAARPLEQEQRCLRCQEILVREVDRRGSYYPGAFVGSGPLRAAGALRGDSEPLTTLWGRDANPELGEVVCVSKEEEWSAFEELLRNWPPMFHSGCPDAKAARGAPAGYVMVFRQQYSPTDAYIQCTQCLMRLGTVDIEFLLSMVRPGK